MYRDNNWDDRKEETTGDPHKDKVNLRQIRKDGVTRHIILVRHGQYDETYKVCKVFPPFLNEYFLANLYLARNLFLLNVTFTSMFVMSKNLT